MDSLVSGRRPLRSRDTSWARTSARLIAGWGIAPNIISLASIAFSGAGAAALIVFPTVKSNIVRAALLVLTAICIQSRLLCNLMDGMVAVEFEKKTAAGDIYNDLPDRISDVLILVPAGYTLPFAIGHELGWGAALLAVLTAYVRLLGTSAGTGHYFLGPMAKPHRMATMTLACCAGAVEVFFGWRGWSLGVALVLVVVGSVVTVLRRTARILKELRSP